MNIFRSVVAAVLFTGSSAALAELRQPGIPIPLSALINGDFEADGIPNVLPRSWSHVGSGYVAYTTPSPATGAFSVAITVSSAQATFGGVGQCLSAVPYRGRTILFDGAMRTEQVSEGYAGLWLRIDGAGGQPLFLDNMNDRPIVGTTDWNRYGISVTVPSNATGICLGAISTGFGYAYVDDLHFTSYQF